MLPDDKGHEEKSRKVTMSDGNSHAKREGDKTNSPALGKNARQNELTSYSYKQVDNRREDIRYRAVSERDKRDNRPRYQTDSTSERDKRSRDGDVRYREHHFEERDAGGGHDRVYSNRYDDNRKQRGTPESPLRNRTDQDHRKRGDLEHEKRIERSERQRRDCNEGEKSRERREHDSRNDRRRP